MFLQTSIIVLIKYELKKMIPVASKIKIIFTIITSGKLAVIFA